MVRTGPKGSGQFRQVSWEEAIERVRDGLTSAIDRHGRDTVLPFGYAGTQGLIQMASMSERFFNRLGASAVTGGLCGTVARFGLSATQGADLGIDPEDVRHAEVVVLWSNNTLLTNRHLWPFVEEAKANGGEIICIDPIRTATAAAADWHVQLLPGTDSALALGMLHVIVRDDLVDHDYVARPHGRVRRARRARQGVPAGAGGRDLRAGPRRRRAPGPHLRERPTGGDPPADRDGAPRARGDGLPRHRLPAGGHRPVAPSRRRPRALHRSLVRTAPARARARAPRPRPWPEAHDRDGPPRRGAHRRRPRADRSPPWSSTTATRPSSCPTRPRCSPGSPATTCSLSCSSSSSTTRPATPTSCCRRPRRSSTSISSRRGGTSTSRSTSRRSSRSERPSPTRRSSAGWRRRWASTTRRCATATSR